MRLSSVAVAAALVFLALQIGVSNSVAPRRERSVWTTHNRDAPTAELGSPSSSPTYKLCVGHERQGERCFSGAGSVN